MNKLDAMKKRKDGKEWQGKRKLRNRIISAVVSAVVLTNSMPFAELPKLPTFSWLTNITSFLPDWDNNAPTVIAAADYVNKWDIRLIFPLPTLMTLLHTAISINNRTVLLLPPIKQTPSQLHLYYSSIII